MIAASIPDGDTLVKLLLAYGANVDAKISKQHVETVRLLLGHKASARIRDRRQQLPLHRAAAVGSAPLVNTLLDAGSPINAQDVDGFTALHHAVAEGHGDAAVMLLKRGADSGAKDREGKLPIEMAPDRKVKIKRRFPQFGQIITHIDRY
ncbi:ankyrin repeat-containing domain protein [Trichophaea hybrida]|nr:ankyrin repeat-containing domain protein [Trichophaea hybrida]